MADNKLGLCREVRLTINVACDGGAAVSVTTATSWRTFGMSSSSELLFRPADDALTVQLSDTLQSIVAAALAKS